MRLLVLDIDRTICDSRPGDVYLPPRGSATVEAFKPWHDYIKTADLPECEGAQEGVNDLLFAFAPDKLVILTARSENLREVSKKWLDNHFGEMFKACGLSDYELNMRPMEDLDSSFISKSRRITEIKARLSPTKIVYADDEPLSLDFPVGSVEYLVYIRNCNWKEKMLVLPVRDRLPDLT